MIFCLSKSLSTLRLDFEKNAVHLIDVNHSFEDLSELIAVILDPIVKELAIQIVGAEGGDFSEL